MSNSNRGKSTIPATVISTTTMTVTAAVLPPYYYAPAGRRRASLDVGPCAGPTAARPARRDTPRGSLPGFPYTLPIMRASSCSSQLSEELRPDSSGLFFHSSNVQRDAADLSDPSLEGPPRVMPLFAAGLPASLPIHDSFPGSASATVATAIRPAAARRYENSTSTTVKMGFYEVESTIGKGNYAVVKLARHRITKTEVAIKIVDKRRLDAQNLAKIYREIDVLKRIKHPNIIKLYQVMESANMLYLVTEYAPNGEMFDLISKRKRLTENKAREKFWQIISAVDYIHNFSIVHRDLKAENLLLDANFNIKLADFGFSNFFSRDETLNTFCGSPPYAAPEVFEGKRYAGPEIDIWSLGVVLYVLVCGSLPFEGNNLALLRDRVLSGLIRFPYFMSSDCEHLIRRMLTVDASRRPTIAQIKRHRWMIAAPIGTEGPYEPPYSSNYSLPYHHRRYHFSSSSSASLSSLSFSSASTTSLEASHSEPHPQILRLMNGMGIETAKVQNALLNDTYDSFHAIYLLLLDRLRGSRPLCPSTSSSSMASAASVVRRQRTAAVSAGRRQSDALPPPRRPALNELREHSTFQTTDCIMISTPAPNCYVHSGDYGTPYEGVCESVLSLQSTGTAASGATVAGSIDEGVESDYRSSMDHSNHGASHYRIESESAGGVTPPFDYFDTALDNENENEMISMSASLASCASKDERMNADFPRQLAASTAAVAVSEAGGSGSGSVESSPCASPQTMSVGPGGGFAGWRASDDSLTAPFPTGQLGKRIRAVHQIYRPSTGVVSAQMSGLHIGDSAPVSLTSSSIPTAEPCSPLSQPSPSQLNTQSHPQPPARKALGALPKRISLPERLELQPQMLLNLKRSIHVEEQRSRTSAAEMEDFPCRGDPKSAKQALKARLQQQHQKRQRRLQMTRQQSYQHSQTANVVSVGTLSGLPGIPGLEVLPGSPGLQVLPGLPGLQGLPSMPSLQGLPGLSGLTSLRTGGPVEDPAGSASETGAGTTVPQPPLSPIEDLKTEELMDTT